MFLLLVQTVICPRPCIAVHWNSPPGNISSPLTNFLAIYDDQISACGARTPALKCKVDNDAVHWNSPPGAPPSILH
jgi:hypothetical protein